MHNKPPTPEDWLRTLCGQLVDPQRAWASEAALRAWLEVALWRSRDEAFGRRYAEVCRVPGVPALAYMNRWIQIPDGPLLLAGIQFKGGDPSLPFVELALWRETPDSEATWSDVMRALEREFAAFRPLSIRLRWPGQAPPPIPGHLEVDQLLLAGRLGDLAATPAAETESLTFRQARDCAWYDQFARASKDWKAQHPELADEVQVCSRGDFEEALEYGAVVCAWVDGQWAGVAAAMREDERALSGFAVWEGLLAASVRGNGWGAALYQALVQTLAAQDPQAILWGTIHGTNLASRRTAEKCGLVVVETWWLVQTTQSES